jgi:hypothetical protein
VGTHIIHDYCVAPKKRFGTYQNPVPSTENFWSHITPTAQYPHVIVIAGARGIVSKKIPHIDRGEATDQYLEANPLAKCAWNAPF